MILTMRDIEASTMTDRTDLPQGDESLPGADRAAPRTSTSYAHDKAKIMARLRRMEGQVRGVQRMVEEDQYCLDVLTQLSAIIAAARQTGLLVLEDHVRGCVLGASRHGNDAMDQEELLTELMGAIDRFGRSVG
jgi:CsoR family transcriptional regulator, copper-sensing transcriptional repressor